MLPEFNRRPLVSEEAANSEKAVTAGFALFTDKDNVNQFQQEYGRSLGFSSPYAASSVSGRVSEEGLSQPAPSAAWMPP